MSECSVKEEDRHYYVFVLFMCELNHHFCPLSCLSPLFKYLTFLLRSNMSIRRQWRKNSEQLLLLLFLFSASFLLLLSSLRTKSIQTYLDGKRMTKYYHRFHFRIILTNDNFTFCTYENLSEKKIDQFIHLVSFYKAFIIQYSCR